MSLDPYKILGVPTYADRETIEAAYRRLARLYHPDISILPDAEERIRELNRAYGILKDPESRLVYDRERHSTEIPAARPVRQARRGRASGRNSSGKGWRMFSGLLLAIGLFGMFYLWRTAFGSKSAQELSPVPVTGETQTAGQAGLDRAAGFPECIPFGAIQKSKVGEMVCMYGRVERVEESDGYVQVIRFSEHQSDFTVRGSSYIYQDIVKGACIAAVGKLQSDAGGPFMETSSTSIYQYTDCQ